MEWRDCLVCSPHDLGISMFGPRCTHQDIFAWAVCVHANNMTLGRCVSIAGPSEPGRHPKFTSAPVTFNDYPRKTRISTAQHRCKNSCFRLCIALEAVSLPQRIVCRWWPYLCLPKGQLHMMSQLLLSGKLSDQHSC